MDLDDVTVEQRVKPARARLRGWLADALPGHALPDNDAQLVSTFLKVIEGTGFEYQLIDLAATAERQFEVQWTHKKAQFVGFTQAPPAPSKEAALLLACDALLHNEWCRGRINSFLDR